jgi:AraC-like DNA-binding protein
MLTYNMDVEKGSLWLRTTPGPIARTMPFYCTEAGLFYARSKFMTSRTNKESYLLFFTLEGKGTVTQHDETVTLEPGQALLIDCRFPQSYGTSPDWDHWIHYWVHLDGNGVKALFSLINPGGKLNVITVPKDSFTSQFDIISKNLENDSAEALLQNGLSLHTLLSLMVSEDLFKDIGSATLQETIQKNANYIRIHCCEQLNLEQLFQSTHLSKSYYMRLFKRYIGTSPYSYMLSCRITKARELLECTDSTVTEISEKTGFSDISAFSVRFTAMTGESPLHYRMNSLRQKQLK